MSAAGFALSWWLCQGLVGLDEGVSLGLASAVLAVMVTVAGWWAARGDDNGGPGDGIRWLVQRARAGRDVNIAGRDQTVINYRRRGQ
jgi:hypothetical protein